MAGRESLGKAGTQAGCWGRPKLLCDRMMGDGGSKMRVGVAGRAGIGHWVAVEVGGGLVGAGGGGFRLGWRAGACCAAPGYGAIMRNRVARPDAGDRRCAG